MKVQFPRPTRWLAFASPRYRPFQAIAVGQAFTASYAAEALFVPLLFRLGAPPSLVTLVIAAPLGGMALQALVPRILLRLKGNLRAITLALSLAEIRGLVFAAIVAGVATGSVNAPLGILLVSATVVVGQTAGVLSGTNISLWTAVLLPDAERRLVSPRVGALNMALSTALLLPAGFILDAATAGVGLWAYAAFFLVGGIASTLTPLGVSRLPRPGRVLVSPDGGTETPPEYRRFLRVNILAYFGGTMMPACSLYALQVLGLSAGYAVAMSGVAAASSLVGSLLAGSFLLYGSASRMVRVTYFLRAIAAICCMAAFPGNPFSPTLLLVGVALFYGAGNAGVLAISERLYRIVPANARVHCQTRFVGYTAVAAGGGAGLCAAVLAVVPPAAWAAYTTLWAGGAIIRLVATIQTEVSPSWRSPVPIPLDPLAQPATPAEGSPEGRP